MKPPRSPTYYLVLASGPALLLLGLAARWLPGAVRPQCMTHRLTGYPCPGCGSTRALGLFAAGKWLQAFLTQPLMTLVFTAVLLTSAGAGILWLLKKPEPALPAIPPPAWKWLFVGAGLALLLNWAYLLKAGI